MTTLRPLEPQRPACRSRRRLRRFIAAHVVGVCALYGIALVAGGGFASAPFPPGDEPAPRPPEGGTRSATSSIQTVPPTNVATPSFLSPSVDRAPPWTIDAQGLTQLITD